MSIATICTRAHHGSGGCRSHQGAAVAAAAVDDVKHGPGVQVGDHDRRRVDLHRRRVGQPDEAHPAVPVLINPEPANRNRVRVVPHRIEWADQGPTNYEHLASPGTTLNVGEPDCDRWEGVSGIGRLQPNPATDGESCGTRNEQSVEGLAKGSGGT